MKPTFANRTLASPRQNINLRLGRRPRDKWFWLAAAAVVALLPLAYANSFRNGFHFDDAHVIVDNLFIRDLGNIPRFFTDALTFSALPANATYRPLVSLTLAIDYALANGLNPFWFHVTQLVLLIATGVLLFLLALKLFRTGNTPRWAHWAALFAAALFCIHTGNTQTANYISARSELLSGLGILGAFAVYLYLPGSRRYYLYLIPFALGMLAKAPTMVFAPLLLAYILVIERKLSLGGIFARENWPAVRSSLLHTAPVFTVAIGLLIFLDRMNPPAIDYGGAPFSQYLAAQTWVWVRYAWLFFVPYPLTADTDLKPFTTWLDIRVLAGLLLLAGSLFVANRLSRSPDNRPAAFGILWFWFGVLPASVFPLAEVTNDHRVFLPFMGLGITVTWLLSLRIGRLAESSPGSRRITTIAALAAVVVLVTHAYATNRRNEVWKTDATLWADVIRKSPNNGRGLMNYGLTHMRDGRYAVARDYFDRAYKLTPNYPVLHVNLGIVTDAMTDTLGAERWFRSALELEPDYVAGHTFYARWLIKHGRAPEAIPLLERAVTLSPADIEARSRLMELYAAAGDSAKLTALVSQTLALDPTNETARELSSGYSSISGASSDDWYTRGLSRTRDNQHAAAVAAYRIAIQLDSTNAKAWNNLGFSLGKLGFHARAIEPLERAIRLQPSFTLARNNLTWVRSATPATRFAEAFRLQTAGRPAEAVRIYRELLANNPSWVNAHYNLGHALMTIGDCPAAVGEFERTLELQPRYPLAHLHLSTCLDSLGRREEAARHRQTYEATK